MSQKDGKTWQKINSLYCLLSTIGFHHDVSLVFYRCMFVHMMAQLAMKLPGEDRARTFTVNSTKSIDVTLNARRTAGGNPLWLTVTFLISYSRLILSVSGGKHL